MAFEQDEGLSAREWYNRPADPKAQARNMELFALFPRDGVRTLGHVPTVLDVGCGFGRGGLYELLQADPETWRYRGFDVLPGAIDAFRMRYPEADVWPQDLFDDAERLHECDVVWCHGLIFETPERLEAAIHRLWAVTRHALLFRWLTGPDSQLKTILWRKDLQ